jgi:hypothetical protein
MAAAKRQLEEAIKEEERQEAAAAAAERKAKAEVLCAMAGHTHTLYKRCCTTGCIQASQCQSLRLDQKVEE